MIFRWVLRGVLLLSPFAAVLASGVVSVDPARLEKLVNAPVSEHGNVFVKFYAPWCGHCKAMEPKYDFVGTSFAETNVVIAKIDADEHRDKLKSYEIQGFPTLMFFQVPRGSASEGSVKRKGEVYKGGREVKQMVSFLNRRCNTQVSGEGFKNVRQSREQAAPEFRGLYAAFATINQFKFKSAIQQLQELALGEGRSATSARRVLDKQRAVGGSVRFFGVESWIKSTLPKPSSPPDLLEDGVITLIVRLDFRSASRGSMEPALLDIHALNQGAENTGKIQVIRLTGTDWDIDPEEEIPYAVAVQPAESRQPPLVIAASDGTVFDSLLTDMQSAVLVQNKKVIWAAHAGIMDDTLIAAIKAVRDGKAWDSFEGEQPAACGGGDDKGAAGGEETCSSPPDTAAAKSSHDEL